MRKIFAILSILAMASGIIAGNGKYRFMIGTYTSKTASEGIYSLEIDIKKDSYKTTLQTSEVTDPSFIATDKQNLYAVNETQNPGFVSAFKFNKKNGSLKFLNRVNAGGDHSCYVDIAAKHVVVANYSGGSLAVFGRKKNGLLTDYQQLITHTGNSVHPERQKKPYVHQTIFSPDKKYVLVNNLGTDKVTCYRYNSKNTDQILTLSDEIKLKAGSGPRHLTFSKNGKYIFVLQELDGTISTLSFNNGKFSLISETTLVQQNESETGAADIHTSPDGKFVYATNRGSANNISCFAVENNGSLRLVEQTSVKGVGPRNFCITKDGKYVLVGNQRTNQIAVFLRDKKSGILYDTGMMINISAPVCIVEF
ncbi:MAG: lactonase family protein [Paludibacteraceae bacterium]|nr:lactonase family protein [Paludibacteraceae bacterium]